MFDCYSLSFVWFSCCRGGPQHQATCEHASQHGQAASRIQKMFERPAEHVPCFQVKVFMFAMFVFIVTMCAKCLSMRAVPFSTFVKFAMCSMCFAMLATHLSTFAIVFLMFATCFALCATFGNCFQWLLRCLVRLLSLPCCIATFVCHLPRLCFFCFAALVFPQPGNRIIAVASQVSRSHLGGHRQRDDSRTAGRQC